MISQYTHGDWLIIYHAVKHVPKRFRTLGQNSVIDLMKGLRNKTMHMPEGKYTVNNDFDADKYIKRFLKKKWGRDDVQIYYSPSCPPIPMCECDCE